jgi:transposase
METAVVSVGIDIGKAKLDVACVRDDRTHVHEVFSNNQKGIKSITGFLKKQRTASTVPCVLESTGAYHLLPAVMLREAGFTVKCINPIISNKYRRASVRGAKTDKVDSARLAEIGIIENNLQTFNETRDSIAAKKLLAATAQLDTLRQQLAAHVQDLEDTNTALGIRTAHRDTTKALKCIDRQIATYRAHVCALAPREAKEIADATPGVSHTQMATLLVGLDGKVFQHRDQLVAFVGLDVRVRQSGKWQGKQVISKRGNGYLRKILFQIGWGLMMNNERYQKTYTEMRARGKNHKTCIIAIARKFLRFLFSYYWKKTIVLPSRPISVPAVAVAAEVPQAIFSYTV